MTKDKYTSPAEDIVALKEQAKVEQAAVDKLSDEIDDLTSARTARRSKLRGITQKIVTIQLREEAK